MELVKIYFDGITEMGACIKNAMIVLPADCTMHQIVKAIESQGYQMFKLKTMKIFVTI